jgi:hypothetical protein
MTADAVVNAHLLTGMTRLRADQGRSHLADIKLP